MSYRLRGEPTEGVQRAGEARYVLLGAREAGG